MLRWLTLAVSGDILLLAIVSSLGMYDCYDTKCRGDLDYNHTFIKCNNYHNYCNATKKGEVSLSTFIKGVSGYPIYCYNLRHNIRVRGLT